MTDELSHAATIARLLRVVQTSAPTAFKSELDGRTAHGVISDAADHIDALRARVAELEKKLERISVDELGPEGCIL